MRFVTEIYEATHAFPRNELYGLTNQLRRAAVSVPSNIAEGQGRGSEKELRQFLCIARGSTCELQTQLEIARRLGFGKLDLINEAEELSNEIRKMLFGMLGSLRNSAPPR